MLFAFILSKGVDLISQGVKSTFYCRFELVENLFKSSPLFSQNLYLFVMDPAKKW